MPTSESRAELANMVSEVFELMKIASTARARARSGTGEEVSEPEFLTLDALIDHEPQTVGEIQKTIGVLPAQMSRIIRSLEHKQHGAFVTCTINSQDRRKIDLRITARGRKAHDDYRAARIGFVTSLLNDLTPADRARFMGIVRKMRASIQQRLVGS
ncbi:MAG: MarR family winged helix-turn-helix transcriptional regulator [Phycisphaerae bacterium]